MKTAIIEPLEWDSGFFGFQVGRLKAESAEDLRQRISAAPPDRFRLIYGLCPTECFDDSIPDELQRAFVCTHVLFRRSAVEVQMRVADGYKLESYEDLVPEVRLRELAKNAGHFSRFRVDAHLPFGIFERMYDVWISRSVVGDLADVVYVIRELDGTVVGFVTASVRTNKVCVIGLIAVAEGHQKRGLGRSLLDAVVGYAVEHHSACVEVTTQAANQAAIRLYESAGFQIESRTAVFHFWSDVGIPPL